MVPLLHALLLPVSTWHPIALHHLTLTPHLVPFKSNTQVRLTFKEETRELWIGSATHTQRGTWGGRAWGQGAEVAGWGPLCLSLLLPSEQPRTAGTGP